MAKRTLNINIAGRVKKVKTDNFLVPLFEAISNSIHSIEGLPSSFSGEIKIEIIRQPRQGTLESNEVGEKSVTGFVLTDNGIGFSDANMDSFCEADSTLKAKQGGKGVGRFSWLKFFEKATIESVFTTEKKNKRRKFSFSSSGIDEDDLVDVTSATITSVTLDPLQLHFESKTRRSHDQIAISIIEHFIAYLVTGSLPKLTLIDGAANIDVKDLYQKSIGKNAVTKSFKIRGAYFKATGIKFFLGNATHTAFLCGDKRAAEKVLLSKRDPFLTKRFTDDGLRQYAYQIFVESEYLDSIVNDDRDGFRFPDSGSLEAASENSISKDEILAEVTKIVREEMSSEITKIKEDNIKTVHSFVSNSAPQYRYVIQKHQNEIATIHDSDPAKIDEALRRIQFEDELKTKAEISMLMKKSEEVGESARAEWQKRSTEIFAKLSEAAKGSLASYIVQRKSILELLKKRLESSEGMHAREEAIHQLIFPMRTTSDDVSYEEQNLWIVDERLSYHYYLASDKPLRTISVAESGSAKEPDIIVFNRPIALNDRPEQDRLESVVILEFKRPGETSVEGQKNPVDQVLEYIELIMEGRAENRKGRPLQSTDAVYFFGYVICELDPLLRKVLSRRTMRETPDGRGMFGFFPDHKAYIEVISYDKMVDDAAKRNKILFEKLQLPPGHQ
jgi:hypothetical protein